MIVYATTICGIKKGKSSHTHTQRHKVLIVKQNSSRLQSKLAGSVASSVDDLVPRHWICWNSFFHWVFLKLNPRMQITSRVFLKHTLILQLHAIICSQPITICLWACWQFFFFFIFWVYFSCLIEPGHLLTNISPFASSSQPLPVPTPGNHFSTLCFCEVNVFLGLTSN